MNIYVAGSSKELARCKILIERIRALGHVITFDWVAHIEASPGGANDGSDEVLEKAAELCLEGALAADIVWVANPMHDKPTAGAWGEMLGAVVYSRIASRARPLVLLSEPEGPKQFCIFQHLRGVLRFLSDDAALAFIESTAERSGAK